MTAGGSAGYKRSSNNTDSVSNNALYSDAKNFVEESGFSHNISVVQNAIHNQSLQSSHRTGNNLIENIGSSLDQAEALRTEAASSFQQAQSYRESASLAQENAVNINSNAGQVVYESLNKQGISPSQIEDLVTHRPDEAISKASGALQAYTKNLEHGWNHGLAGPSSLISEAATQYDHTIKTPAEIESVNQQRNLQVSKQAPQELLSKNLVNEGIKTEAHHELNQNTAEIQEGKNMTEQQGTQLSQKEEEETHKKRSESSVKNFFMGVNTKDD